MEAAHSGVSSQQDRSVSVDDLVRKQGIYYRRRGRTDYPQWIEDYMEPVAGQVGSVLQGLASHRGRDLGGEVLELACGSGYFTRLLSAVATKVTAVDNAAEMLAHVHALALDNVTAYPVDVFNWQPPRRWDAVFMANWLAHVPMGRFEQFWANVGKALAPGGVVIVVDVTEEEKAIEQGFGLEAGEPVVRRMVAGDAFQVIKRYWKPVDLLAALEQLGWRGVAIPVGRELGRGFVVYRLVRADG